jgi:NADPH:quinone reductase
MKAVVVPDFSSFDKLEVGELPDPTPHADEVIVDVSAAEVNYPDLLVVTGNYQFKPPLPFSPGKVAAGVISAIGEKVARFKIGDRVAAQVEYGAYAQKVRAKAHSVFRLPDKIGFRDGAALGLTYQTAHFSLVDRARMKAGDRVLVLGASGGVGVAAVQLAKALGARQVIAGVRGPEKAEIARRSGADAIVNLGMGNLVDGLKQAVSEATDGYGVDVVIDPVGGDATTAALRTIAWCGRMVIVGFASSKIPAIKANYLLVKNIEVSGIQWSDYRDRTPELVEQVQSEIFQLYLDGKFKPIVTKTFPLHDFKEALVQLRDGKVQGKLILEVAP